MKKIFKGITALAVATSAVAILASCGNGSNKDNKDTTPTATATQTSTQSSKPNSQKGDKIKYTAYVKTASGAPLRNIWVTVLAADKSLVAEKMSGQDGKVVFELEEGNYKIEAEPRNGYLIEETSFDVTKDTTEVSFIARNYIITDEAIPNGTIYNEFESAYNFEVTLTNGEKWNLESKIYDEGYSCAFVNMWYANCVWCNREFPVIDTVLNKEIEINGNKMLDEDGKALKYKDKVAFVALDSLDEDVEAYKSQNGYSFDMAYDENSVMTSALGVGSAQDKGWPTTAIIDRYGAVAEIHYGAYTEEKQWINLFNKFIAEDYVQNYTGDQVADLRPDVAEVSSDELAALACGTNYNGTKFTTVFSKNIESNTAQDKEFAWPFIPNKAGTGIVNSNVDHDSTFASLYFTVHLQKDEALTFDYFASTEQGYDILYVAVDDVIATYISGQTNDDNFESCYAYVAIDEGDYTFNLVYYKDDINSVGDDTVTINNIRIEQASSINKPTYIFREASYGSLNIVNGRWQKYITPVLNEEDGYYHVGTNDGPLLLADLLSGTHFMNADLLNYAFDHPAQFVIGGHDYLDEITDYAALAANATQPYIPVTKQLADILKVITKAVGDITSESNENQWLELCVYYSAYNAPELESPVKGLLESDPYYFIADSDTTGYQDATFTTTVIPRGFIFRFDCEKTGVYRFYSDNREDTDSWFSGNSRGVDGDRLRSVTADYNNNISHNNFSRFQYCEAGKTYYLTAAFYDPTYYGTIHVRYEFYADTATVLATASSTMFTSTALGDGEIDPNDDLSDLGGGVNLEYIKSGNYVEAYLGSDGYYHAKDSTAEDTFIYCEVVYSTGLFDAPLWDVLHLFPYKDKEGNIKYSDFVTLNGFNFTIDDRGNPRGSGVDMTEKAKAYLEANTILDGTPATNPLYGCVKVDAEFVEILKGVMAKYSFNVDDSWLKLCYYFITI